MLWKENRTVEQYINTKHCVKLSYLGESIFDTIFLVLPDFQPEHQSHNLDFDVDT